jgi:hypothetical protein
MNLQSQSFGADKACRSRRSCESIVSRLLIWCGALLFLLGGPAGCGDPPAVVDQIPSGDEICRKMCAAIESVSRGMVRVEELTSDKRHPEPVKTTFRLVFDDSGKMLRCDQDSPTRHTKYARTPTESLFQAGKEGPDAAITVGPANRNPSGSADQPLDPHLLWFACSGGFRLTDDYSKLRRDWFLGPKAPTVSKDEAGRFVLQWIKSANAAFENVYTLTVDPTLGFVPVRNEFVVRLVGSQEAAAKSWSEIHYDKKNGYWVPVSLDIHGHGEVTIKVTCNWESVNEAIDPKVFTAEGFRAAKGTATFDSKGAKPVKAST